MAIAENSYPPEMRSSCLQILDPKIWISSEISDPKTWHAYPRMQTWQVPPGRHSRSAGTPLSASYFVQMRFEVIRTSNFNWPL